MKEQVLSGFSRALIRGALAAVVLVGLSGAPTVAGQAIAAGPASVADLAESLQDAVVNISTWRSVPAERPIPLLQGPKGTSLQDFLDEHFNNSNAKSGMGGAARKVNSSGSGFVIDESGLIVTNNHVVEGGDEITIKFADGSKLKAELVGRDVKTDLALLRVKPAKPLKAVTFGDSDTTRVGDWVMAIGNPFGLDRSVTMGVLSGRNRDINTGDYDNFLQTDAAINKGNSGGPLFDMSGTVIGVNSAVMSETIGFAVPSKTAAAVVEQIKQFGEVRRSWIGARVQAVTDELAESMGMKEPKGALVAGVADKGPAEKAGIRTGDVIVKFDGREVATVREYLRMMGDLPIGKKVDVVALRKGKEVALAVELGRQEDGETQAANDRAGKVEAPLSAGTKLAGLTVVALDTSSRAKFKIKDSVTKGLVISDVATDSPSGQKRVQPGDLILEVGQEEVSTPEDLAKRFAKAKTDGRKQILMLLSGTGGEPRFLALPVEY